MNEIENKFLENLNEIGINKESSIILAISGGPDSIALLHLFNRFKNQYNYKIAVCTVDHGIRKNIEHEHNLVKHLCENFNIPFYLEKVDVPGSKKNLSIEESARILRYEVLRNLKNSLDYKYIAVGHTMDDQKETVLLRIRRGSGLSGIKAMNIISDDIIRPILTASRNEIINYINHFSLKYANDPSNEQSFYERVRIRNFIIPELNKLYIIPKNNRNDILIDISRFSQNCYDLLNNFFSGWNNNVVISNSGAFFLKNIFKTLPESLQYHFIKSLYIKVNGSIRFLTQTHLNLIVNNIKNTANFKISLPSNIDCSGDAQVISLIQKNNIEKLYYKINSDSYFWSFYHDFGINVSNSIKPLSLRFRKNGDKIEGKSKKLKDFFNNYKVPLTIRDYYPVLADKNIIIAIPGLWESELISKYCNYKFYLGKNSVLNLFYKNIIRLKDNFISYMQ